jgi:hypothetical protein
MEEGIADEPVETRCKQRRKSSGLIRLDYDVKNAPDDAQVFGNYQIVFVG